MQKEPIRTKTETANFLRISKPTLDKRVREGKIVKTKLSDRRVGFLESDIQAYLANGGVK
jgi:predicted DNA-binding transcriptional regulator AlpA